MATLDTTQTAPDTTQTAPDTTQTAPDTTQTAPDTTQTAPDTTQTAPDTTQTAPDTTQEPAPLTQEPAPPTQEPAPLTQEPAPPTQEPAPDTTQEPAPPTQDTTGLSYVKVVQMRTSGQVVIDDDKNAFSESEEDGNPPQKIPAIWKTALVNILTITAPIMALILFTTYTIENSISNKIEPSNQSVTDPSTSPSPGPMASPPPNTVNRDKKNISDQFPKIENPSTPNKDTKNAKSIRIEKPINISRITKSGCYTIFVFSIDKCPPCDKLWEYTKSAINGNEKIMAVKINLSPIINRVKDNKFSIEDGIFYNATQQSPIEQGSYPVVMIYNHLGVVINRFSLDKQDLFDIDSKNLLFSDSDCTKSIDCAINRSKNFNNILDLRQGTDFAMRNIYGPHE